MRIPRNSWRDQSGFTLVELIIIIVVLGIMATVAIPKYFNMIDNAKESAWKGALGGPRSVEIHIPLRDCKLCALAIRRQ